MARRIGRSRPQISNTIRLLNLPAQVQRRVAAGVLSAGHARALLSLDEAEAQEQLALRIVAEGMSVRATEEIVALALNDGPAKGQAAKRRPKAHAPALTDLADRLSDRFDTRVKVDIGRSKGKITIEFATVDDLERIVGIIGVQQEESGETEPPARSRPRYPFGGAAVLHPGVVAFHVKQPAALASADPSSAARPAVVAPDPGPERQECGRRCPVSLEAHTAPGAVVTDDPLRASQRAPKWFRRPQPPPTPLDAAASR